MTRDKPITVCLVDDHQIVIEGLSMLIESAEEVSCAFTARNGKEALEKLRTTPVDVVLLDIDMPEMDGIMCCTQIIRQFPDTRVVALTMLNERSLVKRMIEAGALGYVLKNAGRDEVLEAIKRVHSGKAFYGSEIADIIIRGNTEPEGRRRKLFPSLSSREKQIVRLILEEFTSMEIANKLNISFNTVETHRRNIMNKLDAKNTAGIVRTVIENNLLDPS